MLMAGTILFGIIAVTRIGVSQFPDVDNPTVSVSVSWPGASPEDVETGIINPIEDAMSQVTGVITITSSARQGSARVTATFDLSRNIDLALQDIAGEDRADRSGSCRRARRRPSSRRATPTTSRSSPSASRARSRASSSPTSRATRSRTCSRPSPGVGQITMMGYLDRNVRIWVDADKLVATGVTRHRHHDRRIKKQHVTSPGGQLDNGRPGVRRARRSARPPTSQTLRNIVIRNAAARRPCTSSDVALVEDGFAGRHVVRAHRTARPSRRWAS